MTTWWYMSLTDSVGLSEAQAPDSSAVCLTATISPRSLLPAPSSHLRPQRPSLPDFWWWAAPRGQAGPLLFSMDSLSHWTISLHPKFKCQLCTDDTKMATYRLRQLTHADLADTSNLTPRESCPFSLSSPHFPPTFWSNQAPLVTRPFPPNLMSNLSASPVSFTLIFI